jgi:hypothetical protein
MLADEDSTEPILFSPPANAFKEFLRAYGPYLVASIFLLCALTFYYFAVLRIDYTKTSLLDLRPYTDAAEYFGQAKGLLREGRPKIQIGYDKLPSKVSFGYPALMLPWLKVLPEDQAVLAPFRTNQTIGLLLLLAVFAFYAYLAMPLTGGFAVLLLATLPAFFTYCRSSMSDISASALFAFAFVFVYLGLRDERRWQLYLAAFFLGLSLNIRPQSLFIAPLLLAMALFPTGGSRLRWVLHCAGALSLFVFAAGPILMLNATQFGSPLKNGYYFWVPGLMEKHAVFSFQNIPSNAATLWSQFSLGWRDFNGANVFGTGTFFVPAFILLVFTGFSFLRLNRFVICAFLAGLTYFAITATVLFGSGRLYLSLLILSVAVAVLPVTWAAKNLLVRNRRTAAICILALFAAACAGYPSQSGYGFKLKPGRSQMWDAMHFTTPRRRSVAFIAANQFIHHFRHQPGIVLSDIDPVYLNGLLPKTFVAAPLDEKHGYRFGKAWRYGHPEAIALVRKGLDQSIPIYALFVSPKEMNAKASRLPSVTGYQWTALDTGEETVVLTLVPAGAT